MAYGRQVYAGVQLLDIPKTRLVADTGNAKELAAQSLILFGHR